MPATTGNSNIWDLARMTGAVSTVEMQLIMFLKGSSGTLEHRSWQVAIKTWNEKDFAGRATSSNSPPVFLFEVTGRTLLV